MANDTDLIDLDSGSINYTADFKNKQDESTDQSELQVEEQQISQSKTSFTTANGDGLTFDPFSKNIFDEIEDIIEKKDQQDVKTKEENLKEVEEEEKEIEERPFEMSDIPDNLKPSSIILEIVE